MIHDDGPQNGRGVAMAATLMLGLPACDTDSRQVQSGRASGTPDRAQPAAPEESMHDLGPILTTGQVLRHEFRLRNDLDRPLKILGAQSLTPCCSAVGSLPAAVLPGEVAAVPVTFRPGLQEGWKQVQFVVTTDDPDLPRRVYSLRAMLTAGLSVEPLDGGASSLALGEPGRQRYRVTCRRTGASGRSEPDSLSVAPPLEARFLGPATLTTLDGGMVQAARDLEVVIPPAFQVGPARGELQLRWADGSTHALPLAWQVRPSVEAVPSGLVLRAADTPERCALRITSRDRPCRILAVSGPGLADPPELPTDPGRDHILKFAIARDRRADTAGDLQITTDHPLQPTVSVSVLILPTGATGGP
jgi:hypothetical protein